MDRRLVTRLVGSAALGLVAIGVAWIVVTGLLARSQLNQAKAELRQLRSALSSGDAANARSIAHDLSAHAQRAHALTTGPAWWVTANIPALGTPLETARTIAAQTDLVTSRVLPGVIRLSDTVTSTSLRGASRINLAPINDSEATLSTAAASATDALAQVSAAPSGTWLPAANSARSSVLTSLTGLRDDLTGAQRAVRTLLPMLGQSTLQRYFVGFENEAEARGLGGLPGAFAILTVDHGRFAFTHFGNDPELSKVSADLDLGADFNTRYGQDAPTETYINSNVSPDFSDAARIWAAMWEKKSGQHVDAAIAVDPVALSYLLKATGAASLSDGSQVSAANVVALTQKVQYSRFSIDSARNAFLNDIAQTVAKKLTSGGGNTMALVRAATKAVGERRIAVWSADPTIQANIVAAGYGAVLQSSNASTGFVVVNAAGSKLDYYLERTMSYRRSSCAAGTAIATFTLTNDAPRAGLPAYVTVRVDHPPAAARPGDNRLLVTYYASHGADITSVKVDGRRIGVTSLPEKGLVTATIDVEVPAQASRTITVTVREPVRDGPLQVLRQPLVRPMKVDLDAPNCN
jgi:hypothetical protein